MIIETGSSAPDFTLETNEGPIRLADYAGRKLVLYFYPKDNTPGCTNEALHFTALADDFAKAGAAVVGVSKDSLASHARFAAKHGLKLTLGSDAEGRTIEAYGSWVEKTLYGRKYMGIDRSTFVIGPDGRIAAMWRKVKVPGHAEAVLKAVQAL